MLGALTVAITLNGLIGMVGADTGGCFNPTIGLTVDTFQRIFSDNVEGTYFKYLVVYICGPLTGSIFAALFTRFIGLGIEIPTEQDEKN